MAVDGNMAGRFVDGSSKAVHPARCAIECSCQLDSAKPVGCATQCRSNLGSAFALVQPAGSVITWGDADQGGDSSAVLTTLLFVLF